MLGPPPDRISLCLHCHRGILVTLNGIVWCYVCGERGRPGLRYERAQELEDVDTSGLASLG